MEQGGGFLQSCCAIGDRQRTQSPVHSGYCDRMSHYRFDFSTHSYILIFVCLLFLYCVCVRVFLFCFFSLVFFPFRAFRVSCVFCLKCFLLLLFTLAYTLYCCIINFYVGHSSISCVVCFCLCLFFVCSIFFKGVYYFNSRIDESCIR